jgi:CubicO group peptidase (beta-lactamase class C family)
VTSAAALPSTSRKKHLKESKMDKLIRKIREKAAKTSFSGVVAIYRGDNRLYSEVFGFADAANKRKNNTKTRFAIASGTKFFTALGIGALIDAGKLTLESTVRDVFHEDFPFIDPRATIAQLLTHSSGIWDYFDEDWDIDLENYTVEIPWSQLQTPSDYFPLFKDKTPKFSPGTRFSYSNGGFIFLGVIIERLTGKLYRDYIQGKIFNPAGMKSSGYFAFNSLPANTAFGYKANGETNIYNLPIRGASDGGAFTTPTDLHRLWLAFFNNQIISPALTKAFITPHIHAYANVDYGYGLYLSRVKGMDSFFIQGGDAGVGFESRRIPTEGLEITVISNHTDGEEKVRQTIYTNLNDIL